MCKIFRCNVSSVLPSIYQFSKIQCPAEGLKGFTSMQYICKGDILLLSNALGNLAAIAVAESSAYLSPIDYLNSTVQIMDESLRTIDLLILKKYESRIQSLESIFKTSGVTRQGVYRSNKFCLLIKEE